METFPYAWAFFVPFITGTTFTMINLFIAIIVSAMQNYSDAEHEESVQALQQAQENIGADLHEEIRSLRVEIRNLKQLLVHNLRDHYGHPAIMACRKLTLTELIRQKF